MERLRMNKPKKKKNKCRVYINDFWQLGVDHPKVPKEGIKKTPFLLPISLYVTFSLTQSHTSLERRDREITFSLAALRECVCFLSE